MSTSSLTFDTAVSTSCNDVSLPHEIFIKTPFAPDIVLFSSKGFDIALSVAAFIPVSYTHLRAHET